MSCHVVVVCLLIVVLQMKLDQDNAHKFDFELEKRPKKIEKIK